MNCHFKGALSSSEVLERVAAVIEPRGFTAENTLFAQSVCPDEINHEAGDITDIFQKYLGEVFHLGGLAGIPFTGKTGFAAFSHHVPDENGHLFVLMAPHVGCSNSLALGKYSRIGQAGEGAACGAAVGALAHCCSGEPLPDLASTTDDYQMAFLMHQVNAVKDQIMDKGSVNGQQAELAFQTHAIAKNMLDAIVSMDFGGPNSKLVIFTGIQINMPDPDEDYFLPLSFEMHTKTDKEDLMKETFGH